MESSDDPFELSISEDEPTIIYKPDPLDISKNKLPPWCSKYNRSSNPYKGTPLKQLDAELQDYLSWIKLSPQEIKCREMLISRLSTHIKSIFGDEATILKFGSYSLGLSIPTSDIDLVVYNLPLQQQYFDAEFSDDFPNEPPRSGVSALSPATQLSACEALFKALSADPNFELVECIRGARIPIVKGICAATGLHFDISMSGSVVSEHREQAEKLIERHSNAKALILLMKHFLAQRSLDIPFTGGIGGYVLINLVAAFYAASPRSSYHLKQGSPTLAADLLAMLEFYSFSFGSHIVAVDLAGHFSGPIIPKNSLRNVERYAMDMRKLTVIDPAGCPSNGFGSVDIGGAAFHWILVKKALGNVYNSILAKNVPVTRLSVFVREYPPMATLRALCNLAAKNDEETKSMPGTPTDSTPPSPLKRNSKTVSMINRRSSLKINVK